jgi:hypothetical protein
MGLPHVKKRNCCCRNSGFDPPALLRDFAKPSAAGNRRYEMFAEGLLFRLNIGGESSMPLKSPGFS